MRRPKFAVLARVRYVCWVGTDANVPRARNIPSIRAPKQRYSPIVKTVLAWVCLGICFRMRPFFLDLSFDTPLGWMASEDPFTLAYEPYTVADGGPRKQPILAGRDVMRPRIDLNDYRCSAVLDWIEIRLEMPGRHQALNIHRKAQEILRSQGSSSTLFVCGPEHQNRYNGQRFILRIQQPQAHHLVRFLKALIAEYAPKTPAVADLVIAGFELSVDFYIKPMYRQSQAASDLLPYRMVDVLRRHLRPASILTEAEACNPRLFTNDGGNPSATFLVEQKKAHASGTLLADAMRLGCDINDLIPMRITAHNPMPVDTTSYIGARNHPVMLHAPYHPPAASFRLRETLSTSCSRGPAQCPRDGTARQCSLHPSGRPARS